MKTLQIIVLSSLALLFPTGTRLEKPQLTGIVSCINTNSDELGVPLPLARAGEARVRYHMGKYALVYPDGTNVSIDRDDELRLAAYGKNDGSVTIYDVFLTSTGGHTKIELGRSATFQKIHGVWKSGDNPGGVATDLFLRDLLKTLSKEEAIALSVSSAHDMGANTTCTVLQSK